jgi:hypothetical protein
MVEMDEVLEFLIEQRELLENVGTRSYSSDEGGKQRTTEENIRIAQKLAYKHWDFRVDPKTAKRNNKKLYSLNHYSCRFCNEKGHNIRTCQKKLSGKNEK